MILIVLICANLFFCYRIWIKFLFAEKGGTVTISVDGKFIGFLSFGSRQNYKCEWSQYSL